MLPSVVVTIDAQDTAPFRLAVVIGSTRPGRVGGPVGQWVAQTLADRTDIDLTVLDVAEFALPLLDEPQMPASGVYQYDHTRAWSEAVSPHDGYVFVTPEYNHSTSPALLNAIDVLYNEWVDKAAGFVGYGFGAGVRPVEHLRLVLANIHVATVRTSVHLDLTADITDGAATPREFQAKSLHTMVDQILRWGTPLRELRSSDQ